MLLTRRNFFRNLIDNVVENVQDSISPVLKNKTEEKSKETQTWVALGNISDFPVGFSLTVNNGKHILISKWDGIYVLDYDTYLTGGKNPRKMIKLNELGIMMMNPFEICPEGTVLSIMTGDFIQEEEEF